MEKCAHTRRHPRGWAPASSDLAGARIERATYDSVAFRYLGAGSHPDHDTLATFRRRFLEELSGVFVQVLELAQEMKLLKLGTVCLDGTKIHANAWVNPNHSLPTPRC